MNGRMTDAGEGMRIATAPGRVLGAASLRSRAPSFSGFPAGARATFVPSLFFSAVLPRIEDPAELVVSLYLFYALGRRPGYPRAITRAELAAERPLRQALARLDGGVEAALTRGLDLAVARGTILKARPTPAELGEAHGAGHTAQDVYLLHTEAAREALRSGRWGGLELAPAPEPLPDEPPPSIFALYEENIGTISPLIAEDLREVEATYPSGWIIAAFKEAVSMNKRNWRYIVRILERWRAEGRTDATAGRDLPGATRRRDLEGRYRGVVRR
jgi:DnaD/phage-associated family protein